MSIQENTRFTVFRLTNEYMENIDNINLWDLAKMIRTAFNIGAITELEVKMLGYNLSRLSFEEIMNA